MIKIFLGLMAFAFCVFIIGLVGEAIGAIFQVIFQLWWLIALLLAIVIALHLYFKGGFKKNARTKANMPRNLDELIGRDNSPTIETEQQFEDFALSYELVDSVTTKLVEVSGVNNDGSSRQQILSRCKHGNPVGLYWHFHRKIPTCAVLSDYGLIGYLETDIASDLYAKYVKGDTEDLYTFTSFVEAVTRGESGSSYGCIIAISICKQREVPLMPIEEPEPPIDSAWLTYGGVEAELLNVDLMEGHQFEYWCADLLRKIGFQNVDVTQASGDDGVDILAEKDNIRYAIQCKRYSSHLGNTPIQEVHAGKAVYNCHVGAVMTNQYFTEGGRRVAVATGTLLWDRDWLRERIMEAKSLTQNTT